MDGATVTDLPQIIGVAWVIGSQTITQGLIFFISE